MVNSRDVARAAGVSQSTVSRVLGGSELVAERTRKKVLEALESIGYAPNAAARTMRTNRTGTIGVVVSRITNPVYPHIIRLLSEQLTQRGWRMVLWDGESPGERSALDAIRQGLVDGVLFTTATRGSVALAEALARHLPVILFNRVVEELDCDQVSSDNKTSGAAMARYLLGIGHRRLGFVAGPRRASTSEERRDGFLSEIARSDAADVSIEIHEGEYSHEHGRQAVLDWFGSGRAAPPTAVFCANDLIAFGAVDGAKELGIDVPGELSIAGHDDIDMAGWRVFDLTTVRQPLEQMVAAACTLLAQRLADRETPVSRLRFASSLVVRGSTAVPIN